jgi:hypothetical protein
MTVSLTWADIILTLLLGVLGSLLAAMIYSVGRDGSTRG